MKCVIFSSDYYCMLLLTSSICGLMDLLYVCLFVDTPFLLMKPTHRVAYSHEGSESSATPLSLC